MGLLSKIKKEGSIAAIYEKNSDAVRSAVGKHFDSAVLYCKEKYAKLKKSDAVKAEVPDGADEAETLLDSVATQYSSHTLDWVRVVGVSSVIGKRKSQQDAVAVSEADVKGCFYNKWMAVLCDGMGGLRGGEKASRLCTERMMAYFGECDDVPEFYKRGIVAIDKEIAALTDDKGDILGAGSTMVSVVIDGNKLYWGSVGDSHIYIIRGNELVRVTREHNHLAQLLKLADKGKITIEQAYSDRQKDALISYMGIGNVSLMDVTERPFILQHGDVVLLCSDGLYRSLAESEIFAVIQKNIMNMSDAAKELTDEAIKKDFEYQDNTSVIVIKYQDKEIAG